MKAHYPGLEGRHILITGGAEGIGRAIVRAFYAQRAKLSVVDINVDALEALRLALPGIAVEALDLRDILALQRGFARLFHAHGPVHCLVNNAAHDERHAFDTLTPEFWDDRIAVNLKHALFAAQAVVPGMRAAGGGSIINLGSNSWMKGSTGMIAYTTAKSASLGLTRSLSRELGADNIRVNCISPGWVMTERQIAKWATPEKRAANLVDQTLKHEIAPEDIADMALFLASDAARMCTGQNFIVDGGITYG